jgi:hypothetical protein
VQAQILQQLPRLPLLIYGCAYRATREKSRELGGMGKAIIAQRDEDATVKLRELREIA